MSDLASLETGVGRIEVFRPRRWRLWASIVLFVLCVGGAILTVTTNESPVVRIVALVALVPVVPVVLYSAALTRSLTVRPGESIEYRDLLGRRRTVPIDATTEIVHFTDVEGSSRASVRLGVKPKPNPIGVIDQRWAVLRAGGTTRIRLSTWFWSVKQLARLALVAPLSLRLRSESLSTDAVQEQYPDFYTGIERHPRWYMALLVIVLLLAAIGILVTFAEALQFFRDRG